MKATTTGAIVGVGVGAARNAAGVRWGIAGNIVWDWIFTIAPAAVLAGVAYYFGLLLLRGDG